MARGYDSKNLAWCVLVIATALAVSVPVARAGKFTIRNEIKGAKGRDKILSVRCWSRDDKLGLREIGAGRSQTWKFGTINLWPIAYTEFRCQFRTAFGTTPEDSVVVYRVGHSFMFECDKPYEEECVWVAKKDGLYLRKMAVWLKERHYEDVLKAKWVWGW